MPSSFETSLFVFECNHHYPQSCYKTSTYSSSGREITIHMQLQRSTCIAALHLPPQRPYSHCYARRHRQILAETQLRARNPPYCAHTATHTAAELKRKNKAYLESLFDELLGYKHQTARRVAARRCYGVHRRPRPRMTTPLPDPDSDPALGPTPPLPRLHVSTSRERPGCHTHEASFHGFVCAEVKRAGWHRP